MAKLLKSLLIIALAVAYTAANAQYLGHVSPNARSLSLSGADIAMKGDGGAIFSNAASEPFEYKSIQATVGFAKLTNDAYSQHRLISGSGYGKLNERHAILAGVRLLTEPRDVATELRPLLQQYSLAYAIKLGRCTALAATLRYSQNDALPTAVAPFHDFRTFGATLSVMSRIPLSKTSPTTCNIGAEIASDFTSAMPYGIYPFRANVGVGFYIPLNDSHTLEIDVEQMYAPGRVNGQSFNDLSTRLGIEYSLMRVLYFRCGSELYATTFTPNLEMCYSPGCAGRFFHLQFDMAYTIAGSNSPLSNALLFNLGLDF